MKNSLFSEDQLKEIFNKLQSFTPEERKLALCGVENEIDVMTSRGCGDGSCSQNCSGKCSGGAFDSFISHGCGDGSCAQNCSGRCSGGAFDSFRSNGCGDHTCANSCYGNASR